MNHTTNHNGDSPVGMRAVLRRQTWVAAAAAAIAVAVGIGLAACGAGDDELDATATPTTTTPTGTTGPQASATGQATAGDPNGGSGSGGSGSGSSGSGSDGGGQSEEPSGPPPRIVFPDVVVYDGELAAEAFGHAYDDDGPDPQLRVESVKIEWGDGTTTSAQLEGHGAFRDYHEYDSTYVGRTVTVRIVAYGHDGETASEAVTVQLSR